MDMFVLNGKSVKAVDFDFNLICDFEDMGISLEAMGDKPMSMVRAYIAKCLKASTDVAGKEMEEHLVGGGKFDDIMNVISEKMESSDFFRSLSQNAEKDATKTQSKKTSK